MVDLNAYRLTYDPSEYAFKWDDEAPADEAKRHQTYGVFLLGSLVNHSCVANLSKVLLNDWVFLRAARDLSVGEELTQFYCDIRMPHTQRRQELESLYGFRCDCPRCVFEEQLGRYGGEELEPYRLVYSCNLPAAQGARGCLRVSQVETVVENASRSAEAGLASFKRRETGSVSEAQSQWLRWPLLPVLSQLAQWLRRDGRGEEAMEHWRSAEAAARAVVPFSNIHVRVAAELLLTVAEGADAGQLEEALRASLRVTAIGFGGGFSVWRRLVGFRMPVGVLPLAEKIGAALAAAPRPCQIAFAWGATERRGPEYRTATVTLRCAAFARPEDVRLYASARELSVGAPGAEDVLVSCPFDIDLELARAKVWKRKGIIAVSVVEKAMG